MAKKEESGSPGWSASFFIQTTEDVARAVADAAAAAIAVHSPRPSVVFQSKEENSGSQLRRLRHQVSRVLKGFSPPVETKKITYNPEVLTSQKRQWASLQLQSLDHRSFKESARLFESIVVVGLHPNCDIQALQKLVFARRCEGSGKFRSALSGHFNSRVEPCLEPQVLFAFPPEKQLPLKYKDLLSFCFPGGVEVHAVEKTPSMSELNEILLGQEHLKQSDLSFVFRLQVADNSTLYGCCVLVDEIVQKPSRLVSMMSDNQPSNAPLSRHVLTTQRCYCLLSRLPFFELHFSVLNSIFTEERFERLTQSIDALDLGIIEMDTELGEAGNGHRISSEDVQEDGQHEAVRNSQLGNNSSEQVEDDESGLTDADIEETSLSLKGKFVVESPASDISSGDIPQHEKESSVSPRNSDVHDICSYNSEGSKQMSEKTLPDAVWPLRHRNYESSESSSSLQGSPCEGRLFRSDTEDAETDETSSSGREDFMDHSDVLEWAKANKLGSLQIICEYFRLKCPAKGSTLYFHPLEHLQPLEFTRPDVRVLHIDGSLIDQESCSTSLERAEVYNELLAEEEATALSVWAISSICGALRLENVLTMFAGALLEKQIVVVCSNLGILAASVLSIVPLIRPFRWQSFLMPVLPNDMLDFLDAPVPYIVGVKNKTSELSKTNSILVDLNKNQVRSPSMPHLPRQKELYASLSPYYSKLVGESYLGKRRPFYDCTDVQVDAAKGFLDVLRTYLNSLCSNLRSHTITNVQSNDDKVSLLLKDSFIDSFHYRDRPFMKLFVDTQLFSVHTDLNLSFYQKE